MMRFTKRDISGVYAIDAIYGTSDRNGGHRYAGPATHKLGRLEDIEEDLGIDLVTLFQALKQGYAWVKENGLIEKTHGFCINETGIWSQVKLNPSDYGKVWALTREELE